MFSETEHGDKENEPETVPDFLRVLRAKEEGTQKLQRALEVERQRRREERAEALAERQALQERLQQVEAEFQGRIQVLEGENEQQRDEVTALKSQHAVLAEASREREAHLIEKCEELAGDLRRLLSRAEVEAADLLAARARGEALSAEQAEVQQLLRSSDSVREGLVREVKEQATELERLRAELRELHLVERSSREHSQAQYERMNAQSEAMSRQAQERGREADVLDERNKRLEEALRVKGLETERALQEAEERRREEAQKAAHIAEEIAAMREELTAKSCGETKLRETIATLEAQIQDCKTEEQRLRQELFRSQGVADERELAIQSGKRREQTLSDTAAAADERLRKALAESESRQTALYAAREKIQTLELDLQGLRKSEAAIGEEMTRLRASEADLRQEAAKHAEEKLRESAGRSEERLQETRKWFEEKLREAETRAQEKLAQRDADISQQQLQLLQRREELTQRDEVLARKDETVAKLRSDLGLAEAKQRDVQAALDRASESLEEARRQLTEERAKLREAYDGWEGAREDLNRTGLDLNQTRDDLQQARGDLELTRGDLEAMRAAAAEAAEAAARRRTEMVADKEVLTSPRLLPAPAPPLPEGQRWGSEIAALHRSVESLQAMMGVSSVPVRVRPEPPVEAMPEEGAQLQDLRIDSTSSVAPISRPSTPVEVLAGSPLPPPALLPNVDGARDAVRRYAERQIWHAQRRSLLLDAWQLWSALARTSDLRARLELAVADELRQATECRARERGLDDSLTARFPEPTVAALKRLVLEFRHRAAAGLAELLPSEPLEPAEARALLAAALERGRRGFGRALHAALFLYQKLRSLVPSELQEPLEDPLSRLVPVPFYVLPYKAKHALHRGMARAVRGSRRGDGSGGGGAVPPPPEASPPGAAPNVRGQAQLAFQAWLAARVEDLEERLPLNASSPVEIPHFMAILLRIRAEAISRGGAQAAAAERAAAADAAAEAPLAAPRGGGAGRREGEEARLHDRLDVLLADALTVYMSAWRLMPSPQEPPRASRAARRHSTSTPHVAGRATPCRSASLGRRELRLGHRPAV